MIFRFHHLRFIFEAQDSIYFPQGKAANVLRGSLGLLLRSIDEAAYFRLFSPKLDSGPSGLADAPRPFVFRAAHLDGVRLSPGHRFEFRMNLFEPDGASASLFAEAFHLLASEGIGPGRGKATLADWHQTPISIDLAVPVPAQSVTIQFLTPTEIKAGGRLITDPDFETLMARVRDRISTLSALYGPGPLPLDFKAFAERAALIRTTRMELQLVEEERHSARTGQRHPLGGFIGIAEYEGPLDEFIPYLEAATHTGLGRQTVWGKGEIALGGLYPTSRIRVDAVP